MRRSVIFGVSLLTGVALAGCTTSTAPLATTQYVGPSASAPPTVAAKSENEFVLSVPGMS